MAANESGFMNTQLNIGSFMAEIQVGVYKYPTQYKVGHGRK
jgi:hypothetical protein